MFQTKYQDITPEQLNGLEIGNPPEVLSNDHNDPRTQKKNDAEWDIKEQPESKTMTTEMKTTLEGINRITEPEERINEVEDKVMKITTGEEERMKRNEGSLKDLWDNPEHTNI